MHMNYRFAVLFFFFHVKMTSFLLRVRPLSYAQEYSIGLDTGLTHDRFRTCAHITSNVQKHKREAKILLSCAITPIPYALFFVVLHFLTFFI